MAKRVVIAEDEAIIRLDLKEILEAEGYEVVGETGRGDEAVELVAEHQPDLAILDIKMPGIDGIEAARRISADHRVAVLILTAFSQRNLIEEARDAGVAAYLVKPFQRGELVPAIEVATGALRGVPGHRGRAHPAVGGGRLRSRTSSRPGGWSTGPRACSWTATAWARPRPSPSSSARPWTAGSACRVAQEVIDGTLTP